ncbi:MAG: hypothetical protein ACR2O2_04095, partial [Ruegeria sp.]
MNDNRTRQKPISLDDLLAANKRRFDELFSSTAGPIAKVRPQVNPPQEKDLASASLEAIADGSVTRLLNERFGDSWSSEVVEHSVESDRVRVLGKLSVGDSSRVQFGEAPAGGDMSTAMQRALDDALNRCAQMFDTSDVADT